MSYNNYNSDGGGSGGSNQQSGEQAGGQSSHISYVKHLSSNENADGSNTDGSSNSPGWVQNVPGGWWTIGIGAATVIIGALALNRMSKSNGTTNTSPTNTGQSGAYYPYGTNTLAGGSQDTGNTVAGAMDNQLSGILGQEQINNQALQAILANILGTGTSAPITTPTTPVPIAGQFNLQSIFPNAKNTPGESNNFWTYITQQGDTMNSINTKANWGTLGSMGQVGNNVDLYRNNQSIFSQIGVTNVNTPIPVGTKISL